MAHLKSPILLTILDGWGIGRADDPSNAIVQAGTPNISRLMATYPSTALACSGEAVGLPDGQMGNSEVGHLNIGSGRVVYQELTRISKAIRDGDFFTNPVLLDIMRQVKASGRALHLMGLLSDGGVHSHLTHVVALLELAHRQGIEHVYVHAFLDGRDTAPSSANNFVDALEVKMQEIGTGRIATIIGRYYAMDRDKRWDRTERAYAALVYREGLHSVSAHQAVEDSYARGETDEFVQPTIVSTCPDCGIQANDGIIFFNFRPDRARQLTRAFIFSDFNDFTRRNGYFPIHYVSLTQYDEKFPVPVAFPPQYLKDTLGEIFSRNGLTQLRIAETEKYAHVTYFFNGGEEIPTEGEDRQLIPSPKVATYDLQPEMSALALTDAILAAIQSRKYDLIICNYANGDMVGHTGIMSAVLKAVKTVDECVGRLATAMLEQEGAMLITADHGNADMMVDPITGEPFTQHTTNEVPLTLVSDSHKNCSLHHGILADISPTILDLAGLSQPESMTGRSLIKK
ncbi:MAG TPA: 2,3-bisphosphoglycerate-independent phosphoglycerate mutase [Negativicutes bacterium]|nr:2,3-bisphosphoglycerate-independent phosphoglycerate mutase [Negativicutes bacterium]